jgi:hypothetical protein
LHIFAAAEGAWTKLDATMIEAARTMRFMALRVMSFGQI